MKRKICVPPREEHIKDSKYEGAYVKEPQLGQHKWVVSLDINSLYPHIMIQHNISPEKIIDNSQIDRRIKLLEDELTRINRIETNEKKRSISNE
jgi:DNA polymerase elongation subunit (family B)